MKKVIFIIPLFLFISCGGSADSEETSETPDTLYAADHEWMLAANTLKSKLAGIKASFTEIGNKEVEETICSESSSVPYTGNQEEMNIWLMSTYILDNFAADDFGKNGFEMPEAMIRDVTPLAELNWMNINSLNPDMFEIYKQYPELANIPKEVKAEDGSLISNDAIVSAPNTVLKAIEDGILGVVVITDYLPPVLLDEGGYETGYMMGYILYADWETEQLSCITPILAENNETFDFTSSRDVSVLKADLQEQTFAVIDSITRVRTGFEGPVNVNNAAKLDTYK